MILHVPSDELILMLEMYPNMEPYKSFEKLLCVEGYPRSGNTYATLAISDIILNHASIDPEWRHAEVLKRMIHHTHNEAVLIESVHGGIPTLALIRKPLDAIRSTYIYYAGERPVEELLSYWKRFYLSCLEVIGRSNLVILSFDDIKDSTMPLAESLTELQVLDKIPESTVPQEAVLSHIREEDKRYGSKYRDRVAAPIERNPKHILAFQNELQAISRNHLEELQYIFTKIKFSSRKMTH